MYPPPLWAHTRAHLAHLAALLGSHTFAPEVVPLRTLIPLRPGTPSTPTREQHVLSVSNQPEMRRGRTTPPFAGVLELPVFRDRPNLGLVDDSVRVLETPEALIVNLGIACLADLASPEPASRDGFELNRPVAQQGQKLLSLVPANKAGQ